VNPDVIANQARWLRGKLTIDPKKGTCDFVDLLIDLADRNQRVPTDLTLVDGYPSGGDNTGGQPLNDAGDPDSRIEALTIRLVDTDETNAQRLADGLDPIPTDPVEAHIVTALDMWAQGFMSLKAAVNAAAEAERISTLKQPVGKTNAPCETVGGDMLSYEIPCGELAFTKGLCRGCYDELRRINDKRQGLEPLTALSRAQADDWFNRRSKRRTHIDGPLAEGA
jgi:hypothetical protein